MSDLFIQNQKDLPWKQISFYLPCTYCILCTHRWLLRSKYV